MQGFFCYSGMRVWCKNGISLSRMWQCNNYHVLKEESETLKVRNARAGGGRWQFKVVQVGLKSMHWKCHRAESRAAYENRTERKLQMSCWASAGGECVYTCRWGSCLGLSHRLQVVCFSVCVCVSLLYSPHVHSVFCIPNNRRLHRWWNARGGSHCLINWLEEQDNNVDNILGEYKAMRFYCI